LHSRIVWLGAVVRRCISPGFGLSHMCIPRPTSLGDLGDAVPALLICRRRVVICGVLAERGGPRVVLPTGSFRSRILTVSRHRLHMRIHIWPTFLLCSIVAAVGDPIFDHVPTRSSSRESLDRRPRGVRRSDRGCLLDLKLVLQPGHLGLKRPNSIEELVLSAQGRSAVGRSGRSGDIVLAVPVIVVPTAGRSRSGWVNRYDQSASRVSARSDRSELEMRRGYRLDSLFCLGEVIDFVLPLPRDATSTSIRRLEMSGVLYWRYAPGVWNLPVRGLAWGQRDPIWRSAESIARVEAWLGLDGGDAPGSTGQSHIRAASGVGIRGPMGGRAASILLVGFRHASGSRSVANVTMRAGGDTPGSGVSALTFIATQKAKRPTCRDYPGSIFWSPLFPLNMPAGLRELAIGHRYRSNPLCGPHPRKGPSSSSQPKLCAERK
jgi:hypothetical protein